MTHKRWPKPDITEEWLERAKMALAARGMKQADLVKKIGSSKSTISRIFKGPASASGFDAHELVTPISRELDIPTSHEMMVEEELSGNELAQLALELERLNLDIYSKELERLRETVKVLKRYS